MYQKTAAVVLRTLKYNDASDIVDMYTRERGRVSFLVPAMGRARKRAARASLFRPLSLVDLEADFRSTASLHRFREARSRWPVCSLPYHPLKSAIALFLAEFLCRALREEAVNEPLFAWLEHSIRWLDECEDNFSNFHLVFLMRLSRFLGFHPNTDGYADGSCFDLQNACFTPAPPSHGFYLKPEEASHIRTLMRMNYETMHLFTLNRAERVRCLTVINEYFRLHLPGFPVLKSLEVLKEVFD